MASIAHVFRPGKQARRELIAGFLPGVPHPPSICSPSEDLRKGQTRSSSARPADAILHRSTADGNSNLPPRSAVEQWFRADKNYYAQRSYTARRLCARSKWRLRTRERERADHRKRNANSRLQKTTTAEDDGCQCTKDCRQGIA